MTHTVQHEDCLCLFLQNEFQAKEDSMAYHLHTLALVYVEVWYTPIIREQ